MIGNQLPVKNTHESCPPIASGYLRGANILRVHNARAAAQALKVLQAITGLA